MLGKLIYTALMSSSKVSRLYASSVNEFVGLSDNMRLASLALVALAGAEQLERRLDNGLGKTPALGWNSWVSLHQPNCPPSRA